MSPTCLQSYFAQDMYAILLPSENITKTGSLMIAASGFIQGGSFIVYSSNSFLKNATNVCLIAFVIASSYPSFPLSVLKIDLKSTFEVNTNG